LRIIYYEEKTGGNRVHFKVAVADVSPFADPFYVVFKQIPQGWELKLERSSYSFTAPGTPLPDTYLVYNAVHEKKDIDSLKQVLQKDLKTMLATTQTARNTQEVKIK
jgi:hypothetical protein